MLNLTGIIVLEGGDATGKTTLATAIKDVVESLGGTVEYIHATYRFKDKHDFYQEAILRKALKASKHSLVLIDRLYLSEQVYAGVFRNKSPWPTLPRVFDRVLLTHGAINIICSPTTTSQGVEWFSKSKLERPEMYTNIEGVYTKFLDIINNLPRERWGKDFFLYNRNYKISKEVILKILLNNNNFKKSQFSFNNDSLAFTGHSLYGRILFLHTTPSSKKFGYLAFCDRKNSSITFNTLLDKASIQEHDCMFLNVQDKLAEKKLDKILVYSKALPFIVSIGDYAAGYCAKQGIVPFRIDDPGHLYFNSDNLLNLTEQLISIYKGMY